VLEIFSKVSEGADAYTRLRILAIDCFCKLIERHPHFNYRLNIMQTLVSRLVAKDLRIRKAATKTIKELLKRDDNQLLDFKLEILKEILKVTKTKPHKYFDPNLLDCLVLNEIMVDEGKAKAVEVSNKKT
jgi:hypothetical protein